MDKIVLICATGRSGSTTMQRIINTIPNSNICGENYGAITSLLDFYIKIHKTSSENRLQMSLPYDALIANKMKPAWYNSYNTTEMDDKIRELIIAMFKKDSNTTLWGFKEIRYDNNKINYIKYFKLLFPQTKVIIQVRENLVAQSQSSWHKQNPNATAYLKQCNKELFEFYNNNKEWCYFTSFERMFNANNITKIFDFIECRENFNESAVADVIRNNIE